MLSATVTNSFKQLPVSSVPDVIYMTQIWSVDSNSTKILGKPDRRFVMLATQAGLQNPRDSTSTR